MKPYSGSSGCALRDFGPIIGVQEDFKELFSTNIKRCQRFHFADFYLICQSRALGSMQRTVPVSAFGPLRPLEVVEEARALVVGPETLHVAPS